jgi:hypothetical protein
MILNKAILFCSSMVPSLKNPLWGEEFNFVVEQLPVEVSNIELLCNL